MVVVKESYFTNLGEAWLNSLRQCGLDDLTAEYEFVFVGFSDEADANIVNVELKSFYSANDIDKYDDDELYDLFYDKSSGAIFILKKGAKAAAAIATHYFIK